MTNEEKMTNEERVKSAKLLRCPGWLCPYDKNPCEKKCYHFVEAYVGFIGMRGEYYQAAYCKIKTGKKII